MNRSVLEHQNTKRGNTRSVFFMTECSLTCCKGFPTRWTHLDGGVFFSMPDLAPHDYYSLVSMFTYLLISALVRTLNNTYLFICDEIFLVNRITWKQLISCTCHKRSFKEHTTWLLNIFIESATLEIKLGLFLCFLSYTFSN